MRRAISKAALAIGAALTSGAVAYAASDAQGASFLVLIVAVVFGFLSFCADSE